MCIRDRAEPQQPSKGEVRIRVQASGLNRAESVYMRGRYFEQPQLPSRIGYEVAGVVEAVGEGVDACWIGKPVATVPGFSQNRYGTLGEETVVPVEVLGEYPANLTPVQAAAIWMPVSYTHLSSPTPKSSASTCGIERWQVFGGSWGSTLALAYACLLYTSRCV